MFGLVNRSKNALDLLISDQITYSEKPGPQRILGNYKFFKHFSHYFRMFTAYHKTISQFLLKPKV